MCGQLEINVSTTDVIFTSQIVLFLLIDLRFEALELDHQFFVHLLIVQISRLINVHLSHVLSRRFGLAVIRVALFDQILAIHQPIRRLGRFTVWIIFGFV